MPASSTVADAASTARDWLPGAHTAVLAGLMLLRALALLRRLPPAAAGDRALALTALPFAPARDRAVAPA